MARTIIIDTAKIPKNPTTAHTRNALVLAHEFGLPCVGTIEELSKYSPMDFDKYVISGSAFYQRTAEIDNFIRKNPKSEIIWLNNEWQCSPNSEYARGIKDLKSSVICNLPESKIKAKGFDNYYDLNVNLLLFREPNSTIFKKYNLIYYGSYRPDRRLDLAKYFDEPVKDCPFYLSSTKKNLRKFKYLAGCKPDFWIDKLNWGHEKETLNLFEYSLYVEDIFSHNFYTHPANRFYECLTCNVVQFFDESCKTTFEQADYAISDFFFVGNSAEIREKIKASNSSTLLKQQQKLLPKIISERITLLNTIAKIIL